MSREQQPLVLNISSPQLGYEQPGDGEQVWVTYVYPTTPRKVPTSSEA